MRLLNFPAAAVRDITRGGAHVSIDALGHQSTCFNSIQNLRRRGRHVQVGLMLGDQAAPRVPMAQVIAHELEIYGSHGMQAWRYDAILALIENGYCEPEEIADELPTIPLDRIKALCVALVNASQHSAFGYEWRRIGRRPLRGQSRLGIFRKDAPALVRSIFQRNDRLRPDMFAVDRAGITEARIAG